MGLLSVIVTPQQVDDRDCCQCLYSLDTIIYTIVFKRLTSVS